MCRREVSATDECSKHPAFVTIAAISLALRRLARLA
jgi:hypothetical protein